MAGQNSEKKQKKVAKKAGLIACLVGGIYGVYQLANADEVKELVAHFIGDGSKLQEQIKGQIKQCVKEALIEYEAERYERERELRSNNKKVRRTQELVEDVVQQYVMNNR